MRRAISCVIHQSWRASSGNRHDFAADLDLPVGIGEGTGLFRMRRGWQHDVRVPRRLGQEYVLHHQVIQCRQRFTRVRLVRIRHCRVLAQDVHRPDLPCEDRIHDLDYRETALRVELSFLRILRNFLPVASSSATDM